MKKLDKAAYKRGILQKLKERAKSGNQDDVEALKQYRDKNNKRLSKHRATQRTKWNDQSKVLLESDIDEMYSYLRSLDNTSGAAPAPAPIHVDLNKPLDESKASELASIHNRMMTHSLLNKDALGFGKDAPGVRAATRRGGADPLDDTFIPLSDVAPLNKPVAVDLNEPIHHIPTVLQKRILEIEEDVFDKPSAPYSKDPETKKKYREHMKKTQREGYAYNKMFNTSVYQKILTRKAKRGATRQSNS